MKLVNFALNDGVVLPILGSTGMSTRDVLSIPTCLLRSVLCYIGLLLRGRINV